MNILHITDELMPSAGGLVSVPICLAAAQANLRHEVSIAARIGLIQLEESGELARIENFKMVKIEDADQPGLFRKILPLGSIRMLKRLIKKADRVHLHGVWDPILLIASSIAKQLNVPYTVTPHSMLHPWQMERYIWQKKIVFLIGWRRMFRMASFIHTLNPAEKEYVESFRFGSDIEIIPNGVFMPSPEADSANAFLEVRQELCNKKYILFLSRLHKQKGTDILLEAFEKLHRTEPDIHLVIVGPDYGEKKNMLAQLSSMTGKDHVHLVGALYGDEKAGAYSAATCFIQPSRNEGFSVSILEALSYGLPSVITENCFFPDVEIYQAGIITKGTTIEVFQALETLLNAPEKLRAYSSNATKLVENKYSWDTIAQESIRCYEAHPRMASGQSN